MTFSGDPRPCTGYWFSRYRGCGSSSCVLLDMVELAEGKLVACPDLRLQLCSYRIYRYGNALIDRKYVIRVAIIMNEPQESYADARAPNT